MPLYMKMSQNINETTRNLKFRYISILTNLSHLKCHHLVLKVLQSNLYLSIYFFSIS